MVFEWFRAKKKAATIADLLAEFSAYQQVIGQISKSLSLNKLGRSEEAQKIMLEAERTALDISKKAPADKRSLLLVAYFYTQVGVLGKVEAALEAVLAPGAFPLTEEERLVAGGALQNVKRQKPSGERASGGPEGFTQVYSCVNCGRLINFISMPCPHCDWVGKGLDDVARSVLLSNAHFRITQLLILAREVAGGREAIDVVPNLVRDARAYLDVPSQRDAVSRIHALLRDNVDKSRRSISETLACIGCGARIHFSGSDNCSECGEEVRWPSIVRVLSCIDNLLWLFERRVEVDSSESFSEFVCVLVSISNDILRKQELPPIAQRRYAMDLMRKVGIFYDLGKGAAVQTNHKDGLKIYLFKDNLRPDSDVYARLLDAELDRFGKAMSSGVGI